MSLRCLLLFLLISLSCPASFAAQRRTPVVDAVARARSAVVNIRTEKVVERRSPSLFGFGDSIFDQFFHDMLPPRSYKTQSLGSGVIIDAKGHILTNAHVVDKASKIFIALSDNQPELEAELIGYDRRIDLAILKIIEPGDYPYLPPGRSDDLMLGETIIAIGNPLGLGHSITTGIVSSLQRRVQIEKNYSSLFIQTDALINPGNSGGPLININGELIGINTAIARQAQGIGFSIPIDTARRVLGDLIEFGRVRRGFLGLSVAPVSTSFVQSYGEGGVLIEDIEPHSPADDAGLQAADVILALGDVTVSSPAQFYSLMRTYTPGDSASFTLLRGLKKLSLRVTFVPLPEGYTGIYSRRVFGFVLQERRGSLVIKKVFSNSAAERAGLKRGDQIARVAEDAVTTMAEYRSAIEERLGQQPLTFTVVRNRVGYLVELP